MIESNLELYNVIVQQVQFFYNALRLDKHEKQTGRKLAIPIPEIIALSLYKQRYGIQTKKALYETFELRCAYKTFVVNMNRFAYLAALILIVLVKMNRRVQHIVKHTDSTDIPVCTNRKAKCHKTMYSLASWSHTGKGAFYGLKLHITTDLKRRMLAVHFTHGEVHESKVFPHLNHDLLGLFIADAAYVGKKLAREFYIEGKRMLMAAARKSMKKLLTPLQLFLYRTRMLIELNFRSLKMFFGLLTSLPRSVSGYLANYTFSLLAYLIA